MAEFDDMNDETKSAPNQPLAAVVTPVYNGGGYLEATLQCVQEQTYDRLVHVVVDNCSTDNTPDIIERFRSRRVELIVIRNNEVLPVRENWTKALCAVPNAARYAKILCADDLIRNDCIARFVEVAESDQEIEVVLCDDIFEDKVRRANLPTHSVVLDGIAVVRRMLDESINWLPYHHLFIRLHEGKPLTDIFSGAINHFDLTAVIERTIRGKFGYWHEPLVYTRWHPASISSQQLGIRELQSLLIKFDVFVTFGRQCWEEATYRKKVEVVRAKLIRKAIKWMLMGNWSAGRRLLDGLRERGTAAEVMDFVRAPFEWVSYVGWKQSWQLPNGPEIDEKAFRSRKFS